MDYTVRRTGRARAFEAGWADAVWASAETAEVSCFRPEGSGHRPRTLVRLVYDAEAIHGLFHVEDRYVRCVRTRYFDEVWKDSCVEFFVQPKSGRGYFNFEFNCGGAYLCSHIIDPERTALGFKEFVRVPPEVGAKIEVRPSLPKRVEPELTEAVEWTLGFAIPFALIEHYVGSLGEIGGEVWRGNFFKCAEEVSHPHWASWSPVDEFNFHRPGCFGNLRFERGCTEEPGR